MNRKVIFFDIDGTLLSTGGAGQAALEHAVADAFSIDAPFSGVLTSGRTDRGIVDELLSRYGVENTEDNRQRFRSAYLKRLPDTLAQSPGRLLPNVDDVLNRLHQADDCSLSILTGNYAEGAWIKLRHYQIDRYFRFGGFGDDLAERDDVARAAVKAAASALNKSIEGADTLVIGDTPADIRCARAIGAQVIAVATGAYSTEDLEAHSPDHLLADFSASDDVVSRIRELLRL